MASIGEDFTTNGDDVKTVTFPTGGNREGQSFGSRKGAKNAKSNSKILANLA